jgi:hypothetical protein
MPETLNETVLRLIKEVHGLRDTIGRRSYLISAAIVFVFALLAVRTEIQQRQTSFNSDQIARTQYEQCVTRRQATLKQNGLIDVEIAAEKREPAPDMRRVRDLENSKGGISDCGRRP